MKERECEHGFVSTCRFSTGCLSSWPAMYIEFVAWLFSSLYVVSSSLSSLPLLSFACLPSQSFLSSPYTREEKQKPVAAFQLVRKLYQSSITGSLPLLSFSLSLFFWPCMPRGLWDLSSLTRDQTEALAVKALSLQWKHWVFTMDCQRIPSTSVFFSTPLSGRVLATAETNGSSF